MKKITAMLCAALLMTAGCAQAEHAIEIEGVIEPAKTLAILAPYAGQAGDADLAVGDVLAAGDALLSVSTAKVYADFDGTVTGVFAQPGDAAASVLGRYEALLYMEREELYSAKCSTSGADGDNEDKIVHVGETVYIQSTINNDREGTAIVTSVSGKDYTLDVTQIDDLKLNDSIKVYRDSDHDGDSCIGSGKISRIDPVKVTAEGHVLAVHVQHGQRVARGDLLLETVPDTLEGLVGGDGVVRMPQDGVLLSVGAAAGDQVTQDQVLATYCPAGAVQLVCAVDEEDLAGLLVGERMTVTLDALGDAQYEAQIVKIAGAADEDGQFAVTLAFEKTDGLRIGMSAQASK